MDKDRKNIHDVRSFIGELNYGELRKAKKIPKKPLFTRTQVKGKGGTFPKIVVKTKYPWFNLFIDHYILGIIGNSNVPDKTKLTSILKQSYQTANKLCGEVEPISFIKVIEDMKYYTGVAFLIITNFPDISDMEIEPEWIHGSIKGHPDLIIGDTIYSIKTTEWFNKTRILTIFRLLSNYVLAMKLEKKNIKKIGLILPAQNQIISADISGWNIEAFHISMQDAVKAKTPSPTQKEIEEYDSKISPYAGYHIKKSQNVWSDLMKHSPKPAQIFLSSPKAGVQTVTKISDSAIKKTKQMTAKHKLAWFVHTPFTINLSRILSSDWNMKLLISQLEISAKMGARGTVVHLGKKAELSLEVAKSNMRINIIRAAKYATKECPILLETGAGCEIYSDVKLLAEFYNSLPIETKKTVAICVDTCHVFASGYTPVEAITILIDNNIPIELIHYNDSLMGKGSRKDRHACIGKGKIGMKQLNYIGQWAIDNNIPLVIE